MSERFNQLAARHATLRAHCALQRSVLGENAQQIEQQLAGVDRAVAVVRNIARKPALVMGGVAVLALLGPRRIVRWASRGALWFTTARKLTRLMRS